jgi:hypothetical protein
MNKHLPVLQEIKPFCKLYKRTMSLVLANLAPPSLISMEDIVVIDGNSCGCVDKCDHGPDNSAAKEPRESGAAKAIRRLAEKKTAAAAGAAKAKDAKSDGIPIEAGAGAGGNGSFFSRLGKKKNMKHRLTIKTFYHMREKGCLEQGPEKDFLVIRKTNKDSEFVSTTDLETSIPAMRDLDISLKTAAEVINKLTFNSQRSDEAKQHSASFFLYANLGTSQIPFNGLIENFTNQIIDAKHDVSADHVKTFFGTFARVHVVPIAFGILFPSQNHKTAPSGSSAHIWHLDHIFSGVVDKLNRQIRSGHPGEFHLIVEHHPIPMDHIVIRDKRLRVGQMEVGPSKDVLREIRKQLPRLVDEQKPYRGSRGGKAVRAKREAHVNESDDKKDTKEDVVDEACAESQNEKTASAPKTAKKRRNKRNAAKAADAADDAAQAGKSGYLIPVD